ncbi:hypothetical protein TNCV_4518931 [Trichonephila clavipes]|nr:hypothetical protein TNCV_4518931 [Trichonephila clavipes]
MTFLRENANAAELLGVFKRNAFSNISGFRPLRLDWRPESFPTPSLSLAVTEPGVALMVGREAWLMKAITNGKQSDGLGFGNLQLKVYYWMR